MKITVLSGMFSGYGDSLAKSFEALGHEVRNYSYSRSNEGVVDLFRHSIPGRLGFDTEKGGRKKFFKKVMAEIETFGPEAILVVSGMKNDFYSEIITSYESKIGKKVPTAIWFMDSYKYIPGKLPAKSFFNKWFFLELTDLPLIKEEMGIEGDFLPSCYDPEFYFPVSSGPSEDRFTTDLSFVGAAEYRNRKAPLEHLAKKSLEENWKFKIIAGKVRFPQIRFYNYPNLRKSIVVGDTNHERNNELYNSCRVNFNIHHVQCIEGLNSRFFEIIGSGGLQIVEPKKAQDLLGFEPDKDFLTYTRLEELDEKVKFVLDHPEKAKEIAESGYKKVKDHDFAARAKFIEESAFSS